jgi:flagellar biosynthesis/type III secretory pathway protein FliH
MVILVIFTNLLKTIILELPKVPEKDDGTLAWAWGAFLKSTRAEEFDKLAESHKELRMAVGAVKRLGLIDSLRWWWDEREKQRMDLEAIKDYQREQGREEGIAIGEQRGITIGKEQGQQELIALLESGKTLEEAKKLLNL